MKSYCLLIVLVPFCNEFNYIQREPNILILISKFNIKEIKQLGFIFPYLENSGDLI